MREKLHNLMKEKRLTSSKLAEQLEIQPSGISHILSGRNKPSFDLLQKILRQFPDINPDWLLLDSNQMYRADNENQNIPVKENIGLFQNLEVVENFVENNNEKSETTNELPLISNIVNNNSDVERIVIFYSDNTFKAFNPRK